MSGDARILIETSPGQSRALYLIDGQIVEALYDLHHDTDLTGCVHRVRIDRVFPAQNRATATLDNGVAISVRTTRHDRLVAGAIATVTLVAAPREAKPWQAVTGARLVGRNMVLLPGGEGITTSKKMAQPPAAPVMDALQSIIGGHPGFGVILRRHAGASGDLVGEAAALVAAGGPGCGTCAKPRVRVACSIMAALRHGSRFRSRMCHASLLALVRLTILMRFGTS